MVPEKQWRGEGQNMDKRTARKVHAEQFQRTIHEIREEYVRAYEESRRQHKQDDDSDDGQPILGSDQIHVYVRKRPVLPHERAKHEFDVISSVGHREIVIHECRMYNDMRHKYITSHHQRFSRCFDETVETETVYNESMKHLVAHAMRGGKAVCMMYGQTGSGKTYTMGGMLQFIADDLFHEPVGDVDFRVAVSAIEIIGSKVVDLLSNRSKVLVCDDGQGNPYLVNCSELSSDSTHALLDLLDDVKAQRSTEATNVNSQSSRSHLVIYINLRDPDGELHGQIALLDLAGSERNEDTFFHDAARRKESIEINKSHLALKECIRAIGSEDTTGFVPYRASTLTRILKGCLWTKQARASVIATVSPISIDTEHTLHALLCAGQMMEENPTIRTDKTDVKEDDERELEESGEGNIKAPVPIREWDNDMVREWICALRKGEFKKYSKAINSSLDGRMLTRFTVARFSQMCNGNATDAAHLFKALRHEMASQEKLLKARREHNAARVASKEGKNNRF